MDRTGKDRAGLGRRQFLAAAGAAGLAAGAGRLGAQQGPITRPVPATSARSR